MIEKIGDRNIECGDILYHVLGKKVSVIKVTNHIRKTKLEITMVKVRHQDTTGMFHVHEFFPDELRLIPNEEKLPWK